MTNELQTVRIGLAIVLIGLFLGVGMGISFGINEDAYKDFVAEGIAAHPTVHDEKSQSKIWRYAQRAHFHANGISAFSLGLLMLVMFSAMKARMKAITAILIGLAVYTGALFYAWRWLNTGADFYMLAIAIGLVQGGVQSLSRSLYARLIPKSKTAEFFGFFNMVGKFAAILGPFLMAMVPIVITGADERDSILSLALLFAIGGFLLWKVDVEAGAQAALEMDREF